ncbi:MAG TPA: ASCH domain-containing protein [Candidatus Angelobacter sp.]|jgi:hypothetical protein
MRTISLWQPWAELISRGLKTWETRHWPCEQFGEVAIHAAKRKFRDTDMSREARTQMLMDEVDPFSLQYGAVLCVADIVACVATENGRQFIEKRDLLYGDWSDGRYGWKLDNVRPLPKPVPLKGHQGWFHWTNGKEICEEMFR